MYADAEELYRATIGQNPDCFVAHNNLGAILRKRGRIDGAVAQFRRAVALKPDYVLAQVNLGSALGCRGEFNAAMANFRKALEMRSRFCRGPQRNGRRLGGARTPRRGDRAV